MTSEIFFTQISQIIIYASSQPIHIFMIRSSSHGITISKQKYNLQMYFFDKAFDNLVINHGDTNDIDVIEL